MTNKPVASFKNGRFEASVWENEIKTKAGPQAIYNVKLSRNYQDSDGAWKSSAMTLDVRDLSDLDGLTRAVQSWNIERQSARSEPDVGDGDIEVEPDRER